MPNNYIYFAKTHETLMPDVTSSQLVSRCQHSCYCLPQQIIQNDPNKQTDGSFPMTVYSYTCMFVQCLSVHHASWSKFYKSEICLWSCPFCYVGNMATMDSQKCSTFHTQLFDHYECTIWVLIVHCILPYFLV